MIHLHRTCMRLAVSHVRNLSLQSSSTLAGTPKSHVHIILYKTLPIVQICSMSYNNDNIVSTKVYDKRDDFDFEIVNSPFLDDDVPRSTSYGVYISQLIRFARESSYVADFNTRNKLLTQKLLKQGYRYHKLRKTFFKIL